MNKTLNRLLTIAIFALLLLQLARLIQPLLPETAPPAAKQYPRETIDWHTPKLTSNLWKISRPDQPDSYLLGTIHMGQTNQTLSSDALKLLQSTDQLTTEVDALPDSSPETKKMYQKYFKEVMSTEPLSLKPREKLRANF